MARKSSVTSSCRSGRQGQTRRPHRSRARPARLNIMEFCKAFNAQTQAWSPACRFPVVITAFADKSFTFIDEDAARRPSPIKKAAKIDKGPGKPHTDKVGKITAPRPKRSPRPK